MSPHEHPWINVGKHKVKIVRSGDAFFRIHEQLILSSEKEIHLHTYIFEPDVCGMRMISCLRKAAAKGVQVHILLDRFGSKVLEEVATKFLIHPNIHFRFFGYLFSDENPSPGRRLHQKVLTVDGKLALLGGINIAGKYKGNSAEKPWLDYALAIESEEVQTLVQWCRAFEERKLPRIAASPVEGLKWLMNDGFWGRQEILRDYKNIISNARSEVVLISSYFLPGASLRRAIRKAAKRGVKIKILIGGISDVPVLSHATNYLLSFLCRHNVEVFLWNESVLHAKLACVDGQILSLGSFNLNNLSSLLSIELNVRIQDPTLTIAFLKELETVFSKSEKVDAGRFAKSQLNIFQRLNNWFSFKLLKWTLGFFRFLPKVIRPFSRVIEDKKMI
jgi:cardiolipin synthase A/B